MTTRSAAKKAAKVLDLPVAAKWFWYSDKGWVTFSPATFIAKLEKEYLEDNKKVKVDDERYIDFNFKDEDEIRSNFVNFEKEKNLVGVQRRYDDPDRRRAVKREAPQIFKGQSVYVANDSLKPYITKYGGELSARISSKATFFLCLKSELGNLASEIKEAEKADLPIVTDEFLAACLEKGAFQKMQKFLVSSDSKSKKGDKRKKDDSDEEDDGKKSKKNKKDSDDKAAEYSKILQANSEFKGHCEYSSDEAYDFQLIIQKVVETSGKELVFEGQISWDLGSKFGETETKVKGKYDPKSNKISLEEYEAIKGEENLDLPANYKGEGVKNTSFKGKVVTASASDSDEATWKMEYVGSAKKSDTTKSIGSKSSSVSRSSSKTSRSTPAVEKFEFKKGDRTSGYTYDEKPFTLTITSRDNKTGKLEGKIQFEGSKSSVKFTGTFKNSKLSFETKDNKFTDGLPIKEKELIKGKQQAEVFKIVGNIEGSEDYFEIYL